MQIPVASLLLFVGRYLGPSFVERGSRGISGGAEPPFGELPKVPATTARDRFEGGATRRSERRRVGRPSRPDDRLRPRRAGGGSRGRTSRVPPPRARFRGAPSRARRSSTRAHGPRWDALARRRL